MSTEEAIVRLSDLKALYGLYQRSYICKPCPVIRIAMQHTIKRIYQLDEAIQNQELDDSYDQNTGKLNKFYRVS